MGKGEVKWLKAKGERQKAVDLLFRKAILRSEVIAELVELEAYF